MTDGQSLEYQAAVLWGSPANLKPKAAFKCNWRIMLCRFCTVSLHPSP